jgi:hypothetical protein
MLLKPVASRGRCCDSPGGHPHDTFHPDCPWRVRPRDERLRTSQPRGRQGAARGAAQREATTVIKWKADGTYDTLRAGTNTLVCYDQSGQPTEQPFAVQCTSKANLDRVAQNKKFEMEPDREKRAAAIAAAEKDGTRIKPEYGSVFWNLSGKDQETARAHMTVATPGATTASTGLPDHNKLGGAWIMGAGTSGAHIMIPGS